jgi:hypothetical protein
MHTYGCDPPRGLQGYGLGFSHSQRTGAVLALRVTESLVDTCGRVSVDTCGRVSVDTCGRVSVDTCSRVSDAHRWVSHFSVIL